MVRLMGCVIENDKFELYKGVGMIKKNQDEFV